MSKQSVELGTISATSASLVNLTATNTTLTTLSVTGNSGLSVSTDRASVKISGYNGDGAVASAVHIKNGIDIGFSESRVELLNGVQHEHNILFGIGSGNNNRGIYDVDRSGGVSGAGWVLKIEGSKNNANISDTLVTLDVDTVTNAKGEPVNFSTGISSERLILSDTGSFNSTGYDQDKIPGSILVGDDSILFDCDRSATLGIIGRFPTDAVNETTLRFYSSVDHQKGTKVSTNTSYGDFIYNNSANQFQMTKSLALLGGSDLVTDDIYFSSGGDSLLTRLDKLGFKSGAATVTSTGCTISSNSLKKLGKWCVFNFVIEKSQNANYSIVLSIPAGFRPKSQVRAVILEPGSSNYFRYCYIDTSGSVHNITSSDFRPGYASKYEFHDVWWELS